MTSDRKQRYQHRWPTLVVQLGAVCFALALAWLLRFEFSFPYPGLVLTAMPVLIACRGVSLASFRLTHNYWRYTGIGDLADLVNSIVVGSALFFVVTRLISYNREFPRSLPISIYFTEAVLSLLLLAALRAGAALVLQWRATRRGGECTEILIIGAGYAGAMLLRGLRATTYKAVGLLDDNPSLHHSKVCGVPVLGGIDRLPEFVSRHGVKEVLIAIPSATGSQLLRISEYCIHAEVSYRAVPSLPELLEGKHPITELRELNLNDLLGRDPIRLESAGVRTRVEGKVVLVTGAAGSIGSELCKQIVHYAPGKIICVDQSETPLFHLQQTLLGETNVPVVFSVTDVGNKVRMKRLLETHDVGIIFHAAAYKHVPMVETNAYDGIRNNVFALVDLLEVAEDSGCGDFVLISTDKAVNPSSLMGCTKRLGEMMAASRQHGSMRCVTVRFGNVLGSQGSVIPTFRNQIRNGCPITVTHPQITRYFMTIPEAVSLTLEAFTIGEHGDILVLDMGDPISIVALAKTLIRISGKSEREIPIVFTGLRPGEKLHESLFYDSELRVRTVLKRVMRARSKQMNWSALQFGLLKLRAAMHSHDDYRIRCVMKELIPEYEWAPDPLREPQTVAQLQIGAGDARLTETVRLHHSPRPIPIHAVPHGGLKKIRASTERAPSA